MLWLTFYDFLESTIHFHLNEPLKKTWYLRESPRRGETRGRQRAKVKAVWEPCLWCPCGDPGGAAPGNWGDRAAAAVWGVTWRLLKSLLLHPWPFPLMATKHLNTRLPFAPQEDKSFLLVRLCRPVRRGPIPGQAATWPELTRGSSWGELAPGLATLNTVRCSPSGLGAQSCPPCSVSPPPGC